MATQQEILNEKIVYYIGDSVIKALDAQAAIQVLSEELKAVKETQKEEVELEVPEEGEAKNDTENG